jgi:hypothetical protein
MLNFAFLILNIYKRSENKKSERGKCGSDVPLPHFYSEQ